MKILKVNARDIATGILIILLLVSLYHLVAFDSVASVVTSLLYSLAILYISVLWILTWPIANKLLGKASDMEYDVIEKEIAEYSKNKVKLN